MSNLLSLTDTTWTGVNTVFAIVFRISFLLLVFDDFSDWLFFLFSTDFCVFYCIFYPTTLLSITHFIMRAA